MAKSVAQLKRDFPVFTLLNRRQYPVDLVLNTGSVITVAAQTTIEVKSTELARIPARTHFYFVNPTSRVLRDYDVYGNWSPDVPLPPVPDAPSPVVVASINDNITGSATTWSSQRIMVALDVVHTAIVDHIIDDTREGAHSTWSSVHITEAIRTAIAEIPASEPVDPRDIIDDAATDAVSVWSAARVRNYVTGLVDAIPALTSLIADSATAPDRLWSSQKTASTIADIVSSAIGGLPLVAIDDTTPQLNRVYSSQRVVGTISSALLDFVNDDVVTDISPWSGVQTQNAIASVVATAVGRVPAPTTIIYDIAPSATLVYSSQRVVAYIANELAKLPAPASIIDDASNSSTRVWSGQRVAGAIAALPSPASVISDGTSTTTNTWSARKIATAFSDLPLPSSVISDAAPATNAVYSSRRVADLLVALPAPASLINDSSTSPTVVWSARQVVNYVQAAIAEALSAFDPDTPEPVPALQPLTLSTTTTDEGVPNNTLLAVIQNVPADTVVTLTNNAGGVVALDGLNLRATPTAIVYSSATPYIDIVVRQVRASTNNETLDTPLRITVRQVVVVQPATFKALSLSNTSIAENNAATALLGNIIDANPTGTALTILPNDYVQLINGAVYTKVVFNFEGLAQPTFTFTLRETDNNNSANYRDTVIVVTVTNVREVTLVALDPVAVNISALAAENTTLFTFSNVVAGTTLSLLNGETRVKLSGNAVLRGAGAITANFSFEVIQTHPDAVEPKTTSIGVTATDLITTSPTLITVTPASDLAEPVGIGTVVASITVVEGALRSALALDVTTTTSAPLTTTLITLP